MMNPSQVHRVKFRFMTHCHKTFWVWVLYLYFKIIQSERCIHWIWCSDWMFKYKTRTQMVYVRKSWWDSKVKRRTDDKHQVMTKTRVALGHTRQKWVHTLQLHYTYNIIQILWIHLLVNLMNIFISKSYEYIYF